MAEALADVIRRASRFAVRAGRVVLERDVLRDGVVVVEDGRISAVAPSAAGLAAGLPTLDFPTGTLLPGMIDLHVHGHGGWRVGSEDAPAEAVRGMRRALAATGVTGFLPTIATASDEVMLDAVRAVAEQTDRRVLGEPEGVGGAPDPDGGARVLGSHLEGPYLNPVRKGAMRGDLMRRPDVAHFERAWEASEGTVRYLTLAPELDGADELIDHLVARGIVVSAGHTDATAAQTRDAFARGVRSVTHLFNAMRGLHHREPGVVGAALTSGAPMVELIADGVHVHPDVLRLAIAAKGADRVVVVSDTGRYAGMASGTYEEPGRTVVVDGVRCAYPNGTLAGSASPMHRNVALLRDAVGRTWPEIAAMTATNAAALLGLGHRTGRIAKGLDADLFVLDDGGDVSCTLVRGRPVHLAEGRLAERHAGT